MAIDLGKNVQTLSVGDAIKPVTQVDVQYGIDSSGNPLIKTATASPNNGRTVTVTTSHIAEPMAQTVANNILAQFTGITYNSLVASGAELDPACELFDEVVVDNIATALGAIDTTFNKAMFADIEAQGIPEDDDFPFTTLIERQVQRADTKADSAISGLADKASKTEAQGYANTAEQNAKTSAQGYANTAEQNAKNYASQQASAAQTAAEANAAIDAATKANAARTNAVSDVNTALAAGITTISGNCITTGTVNANLITAGTMAADRISGGSLVLGGANNIHGQLYIQDANNNNIGTWNRNGISISSGSIAIENPSTALYQAQYFPLTKNSSNNYIITTAIIKFEAGLESEALADLSAIGISLTRAQFISTYDVNGDGAITSRDATTILQWFTCLEHLTSYNYDSFRMMSTTYVDPIGGKYISVANAMYVYASNVYLAKYDWFSSSITPNGISTGKLTVGSYDINDFVVESGTSTSTATTIGGTAAGALSWKYRKWSSGKLELWATGTRSGSLLVNGTNTIWFNMPSMVTGVENIQGSHYIVAVPGSSFLTYVRARNDSNPYWWVESYVQANFNPSSGTNLSIDYYVLGSWN